MSAVPTNLPPWAEKINEAMLRAADHKLAAVSVPTRELRELWLAWHNEKAACASLSQTLAGCVETKDRACEAAADNKAEADALRKGIATAIQTLEATACGVR